jgi:hypothetical protein
MNKVSASIVTYNNSNEIEGVLSSFHTSSYRPSIEVFIVDNNSSDDTLQRVRQSFPDYKILSLSSNLGYGAGHNQAIKVVESEYHVIVNPDITFAEGIIDKLVSFMEVNPDIVLCSPKILNIDGTVQHLPKRKPSLKYLLGGFLENKGSIFKQWRQEFTLANVKINIPIEIDFCSGCFMFFRTEALKKCGGFDDRYFMYFEDADLTREIQKFGKTVYNPDIEVVHEWKRDNRTFKGLLRQVSSMCKYFYKWNLH